MENSLIVQNRDGADHLDENSPNCALFNQVFGLLLVDNLLIKVTIVGELHHKAKTSGFVFEECFFVCNDALVGE